MAQTLNPETLTLNPLSKGPDGHGLLPGWWGPGSVQHQRRPEACRDLVIEASMKSFKA